MHGLHTKKVGRLRGFWRRQSRKVKVGIVAFLAVMMFGSAAFAYLLAEASGSGSTTTNLAASAGTEPVTVLVGAAANAGDGSMGTAVGVPTYGGAGVPVDFSISNTSGSPANVGTITPTVTVDAAHVTAGCLASWFTVTAGSLTNGNTGSTFPLPVNLPGTGTAAVETLNDFQSPGAAWSLSWPTNGGVMQNSCLGATLTVSIAIS